MCKRNNDALFFTCSLIEQLGRSLHMRRGKVAAELGGPAFRRSTAMQTFCTVSRSKRSRTM